MSNSYAQYVNNTYLICEKKLPAAKPDEAEKSGARVPPSDPALLRPLVLSVSPTAHGFLTVLFPSDYYIPACWRSVSRREASFLTKKSAGGYFFSPVSRPAGPLTGTYVRSVRMLPSSAAQPGAVENNMRIIAF